MKMSYYTNLIMIIYFIYIVSECFEVVHLLQMLKNKKIVVLFFL